VFGNNAQHLFQAGNLLLVRTGLASARRIYRRALSFKQASTHEEKIACLEEMLRVIPKHKGTDKLQSRSEATPVPSSGRRHKKLRQTHRGYTLSVETEGAGQIVLVGPPTSANPRYWGHSPRLHPK